MFQLSTLLTRMRLHSGLGSDPGLCASACGLQERSSSTDPTLWRIWAAFTGPSPRSICETDAVHLAKPDRSLPAPASASGRFSANNISPAANPVR